MCLGILSLGVTPLGPQFRETHRQTRGSYWQFAGRVAILPSDQFPTLEAARLAAAAAEAAAAAS